MSNSQQQRGVTLVEMMIAMVISLILMAGVYQTYLGSKQAYRTQDGLSRLQENARFAVDQISRDLRMANNFGCVPGPVNQFGEQVIFDRVGDTAFNYDPNNTARTGIAAGANTDGSDTLTIRSVGNSDGLTSWPVAAVAGTDVTLLGGTLPEVGDNVVISSCLEAEISQVAAVNTTTRIVTLSGITGTEYDTGTMVYPVQRIAYTVATGAGGQQALFRQIGTDATQELAEGLQSINFLYRETGNAAFTTSDAVGDWNNIEAVRVNLVFSTPRDNIAVDNQTYRVVSDDGTAITTQTAADRRLYRMMSVLVDVRK